MARRRGKKRMAADMENDVGSLSLHDGSSDGKRRTTRSTRQPLPRGTSRRCALQHQIPLKTLPRSSESAVSQVQTIGWC